jgi:hypothetical protein
MNNPLKMNLDDHITSTPDLNKTQEFRLNIEDELQANMNKDGNDTKPTDTRTLQLPKADKSFGDSIMREFETDKSVLLPPAEHFEKYGYEPNYGESIDKITPLLGKGQRNSRSQIATENSTRDISNPNIRMRSTGRNIFNTNPVKDAFNKFDKSQISFSDSRKMYSSVLRQSKNPGVGMTSFADRSFQQANKGELQTQQSTSLRWTLLTNTASISNLSLILQLVMNAILILLFLSLVLFAFFTIKKDVNRKVSIYVSEEVHKIGLCRRDYLLNNCALHMRVPALEARCNAWEKCMNEDPESVITSMAYFEVLADCINVFFGTISMKSLICIGFFAVFCVIFPNLILNRFRSTTINKYYNSEPQRDVKGSNYRENPQILNTPRNKVNTILGGSGTGHITEEYNTSVRFDPNVSNSYLEDEEEEVESPQACPVEESEQGDESEEELHAGYTQVDELEQGEDVEDDEDFPGNQRVIIDQ